MQYYLSLLCLVGILGVVSAQSSCPKYDAAMQQGEAYLEQDHFRAALIEFQAAQIAVRECALGPAAANAAATQVQAVFKGLREQRDAAKQDEERARIATALAEQQVRQTDQARKETTVLLTQADSLNRKNQRLINSLYFYQGKFALAIRKRPGGNIYGFIDKQGNTLIDFKYESALPFENNGFAKVGPYPRLIDTTGREFPLAESLDQLSSRTRAVDLTDQKLSVFPDTLLAFPELEILLLGRNDIMELPAEIERLSKLRYLDLQGNELQEIPAGIGRLQQLSYLNMDRNALKRLPASIGQLQQLQELNLGSNALEQLPPEIGGLSGLSQLKLEENKLRQLPPEIGRLQGLQWLELGNNELQQLPPELGQLFQLQFLGLRENHLQALPPAIGQLQQLEQLDLRNNSLTHLPSEIGRLQQLRQLNLFDNQLQELPVEINQLHQLESILFSWNRLIRLPGQLETWDNEVVIDAFIQEWRTKHALRAPYPERDQHFDREMEYLYTTRIRLAEQDPDQPALRQLYRDLAWFQLITGQFAAAETTIRKNMALAPDDPKAALLLPHSLLFQGKTAAATNAYLELKDHQQQVLQVDGHNISTRNAPYSEAFLQDLEEFERMKIVPEGRQKQVEIIRQLLRE